MLTLGEVDLVSESKSRDLAVPRKITWFWLKPADFKVSKVEGFNKITCFWFKIPRTTRSSEMLCLVEVTGREIIIMLRIAYGDAALSKTRVYECPLKTKLVQDASERPELEKTSIITIIRESHCQTIDQLSEISDMSCSSTQRNISKDLYMGGVAAKFVPQLLTDEKNPRRLQACFVF